MKLRAITLLLSISVITPCASESTTITEKVNRLAVALDDIKESLMSIETEEFITAEDIEKLKELSEELDELVDEAKTSAQVKQEANADIDGTPFTISA